MNSITTTNHDELVLLEGLLEQALERIDQKHRLAPTAEWKEGWDEKRLLQEFNGASEYNARIRPRTMQAMRAMRKKKRRLVASDFGRKAVKRKKPRVDRIDKLFRTVDELVEERRKADALVMNLVEYQAVLDQQVLDLQDRLARLERDLGVERKPTKNGVCEDMEVLL